MSTRDTIRLRRASTIRRQKRNLDLPLLDGTFRRLLDIRPDLADVAAVGRAGGGGDGDGLDEEFVAAAGVGRGLFFHCLQEDLHFHRAGGFDAAGVGADAVSMPFMLVGLREAGREGVRDVLFRGGGLDFEGYGVGVGVAEAEDLGDFVVEGACVWGVLLAFSSGSRARSWWLTLEAQLDGLQLDGHGGLLS